jgi:hypothetical protein
MAGERGREAAGEMAQLMLERVGACAGARTVDEDELRHVHSLCCLMVRVARGSSIGGWRPTVDAPASHRSAQETAKRPARAGRDSMAAAHATRRAFREDPGA